MRAFLGVALIISLMVMESNAASNELTCTICVDIVTEIGNIVSTARCSNRTRLLSRIQSIQSIHPLIAFKQSKQFRTVGYQ